METIESFARMCCISVKDVHMVANYIKRYKKEPINGKCGVLFAHFRETVRIGTAEAFLETYNSFEKTKSVISKKQMVMTSEQIRELIEHELEVREDSYVALFKEMNAKIATLQKENAALTTSIANARNVFVNHYTYLRELHRSMSRVAEGYCCDYSWPGELLRNI